MTCRLATAILATSLLLSTGCGSGNSVGGLKGFGAQVLSNNLYVSFTATHLNITAGGGIPIPGISGSLFSITPALSGGGAVFAITVPISSLAGLNSSYAESGFPDGRPLPDVLNGQLPRYDVTLFGLDISLYINTDAFGIFIPIKLFSSSGNVPLPTEISIEIKDERGNLIGKAYAIPGGGKNETGIFILLPFLGQAPQARNAARLQVALG